MFSSLLTSLVALSLLSSFTHGAPGLVTSSLERRNYSPRKNTKLSPDANGNWNGPTDILGDPGITCKEPSQFPKWTVKLDAIQPGCYEQGQTYDITWKIVEATEANASPSPVIYFSLVHYEDPNNRKGSIMIEPSAEMIALNGESVEKPVCANDLKTKIRFPPAGELWDRYVYPALPYPWSLAASFWVEDSFSFGEDNDLDSAPDFNALNNDNGFFVTVPGGCKNFKRPT